MTKFQEVLINYKDQTELSYAEFADELSEAHDISIHPATIMGWKAGRSTPTLKFLLRIYKAYELDDRRNEFAGDAVTAWLKDRDLTFEMTDKFYDSL
jgi:transcriptional regulator with XRE-family HTH domain